MPMAASPEAGVVDLLKCLRSHICCESRSDLRRILPVYQRLLSPREDTDVSVQNELLGIRAKLLACGEDADVADVVSRMDRVVECCLSIQGQKNQGVETTVPMDEVMRLLVALAGGEDGETFVLEDPMQATNGKSSMVFGAEKKRIGDRIRMNDVEMVQRSKALFHKAPVSHQDHALFSQDLFDAFGNGISSQHASLWCPDNSISEDKGLRTMRPFKKPNQFFGLPGSPTAKTELNIGFTVLDTLKRQRHEQTLIPDASSNTLKTMKPGQYAKSLSPRKEVFFYDGTQEVHCGEQIQKADWGEVSSMTENSSWGSESSLDISEPWIARTYAWEDLGGRMGLPESYAKPLVRGEKRSLRDLVVPDAFACRNYVGDTPLEIHEEDFIEDALRALSGVESTIFRRDLQSASFQLPEMRMLKLRNTTISATMSVLEVFRKAGTTVMRLELLAVYYSQNPARGGKTLQAMGDALQLYLSTHRTCIESIAQQCLESSGEAGQEDEFVSITKLVCKTRKVCRVLEIVGEIYSCEDHVFWPLLQEGKFPRGIALLNRLYHHVSSLRVEDSSGSMQALVIWFLVKSCSPFLAVLSDLISSGRVDESTDPFDEFKITAWSRNLHAKIGAGGGDGLFSEKLSTEAVEMLPKFLERITPLIIHLSHVKALLRGMDAIASTHPLVNMQSLIMLTRGDDATRHAEEWHSTIAKAMTSTRNNHQLNDVESYESLSEESCATDEEGPLRDFMHEDAEAKRNSQLQQRSMLDQQVLEKRQHQLHLAQQQEADDTKRVDEVKEAQAEQDAYGRELLFKTYSLLMNGAEERHDYMKWRRDRAIRISKAKEQLKNVHVNDVNTWTAEMEKQRKENLIRTTETEDVNFVIDEDGDRESETSDIGKRLSDGATRVPLTSVSTSERKTSVKVNKEAGNRTSISIDEDGWRTSVKVNKEAGSRTSASIGEYGWRASVKVNKEAGTRSSGVLNDPASTEVISRKTGIRILNEPGGSGANMYGTLYGGSEELPKECVQSEVIAECVAANATDDVELEDCSSVVDAPMDAVTPCDLLSEANEVEMQNATHDGEEIVTSVDHAEKLPAEASGNAGKPMTPTRISLPPVHPFFLANASQADSEVLTSALTESTSAVEFTSFKSIVDCCVETPVRLVAENLEQVALDWLHSSLHLLEHLRWLRRLMLMAEGLCMDIFARDFLHGLSSATRVNWGLEGRLSSALSLAMIEGSVKLDSIAQNFHYETTAALSQVLDSLTMTPAVSSVLSEIELVYDVKWPLGLVITSKLLDQYKQIHRFLLHVRLTSLEMRGVWGILRTIRRQGRLSPELERLCGNVVYKMQAVVRAFNETFATKVLMAAWTELEHGSQKAATLVELRRCHEEYVSVAVRCCFLDRPSLTIHSAFLDTLATTWSLTGFVRAQVTGRACEETRTRALCNEFNTALQGLVGSLQSVTRDAERNTQEFSECLLLRLNFNQYYDDSVAHASEYQDVKAMPPWNSSTGHVE